MEKANHIETKEKIFSYLENQGWKRESNGLRKTIYGGYKGSINPLGKRMLHIMERKINKGYFLECTYGPDVWACISLEYPTILPNFPETMDLPAIANAFNERINKYADYTAKK